MLSLFQLSHSPLSMLIITFLTHKYISTKHPVQYKNFCYNCAYYSIYLYSKAQIIYFKINYMSILIINQNNDGFNQLLFY